MVSENTITTISNKHCVACNKDFGESLVNCPDDGSFLMPVYKDPLIGTTLSDRYEILSVIGQGGMGVVYKARHAVMDRFVAIKMLLAKLISDANSVKRFYHEAKAVSRLSHPNIIAIHDFGVTPIGQPFLVMDYLQGTSLAEVIRKDGKVGVDRSIRIFSQTCDALEHAHEQGVVHRDLKPSNIMLADNDDERDFVKVVDFGVAKLVLDADEEAQRLTQTGEICGSPVYMSPEQCLGQLLDARSDIYSTGIMIYEALTGQLPLLGTNMVETMSKHIAETPQSFADVRPDLYIPERLEAVVFKALQKNPSHRHQSMSELKQELISAIPQPARSQTLRTMVPKEPNQLRNKVKLAPKLMAKPVLITAIVISSLSAAFGWLAGTGLLVKMVPSLATPARTAKVASAKDITATTLGVTVPNANSIITTPVKAKVPIARDITPTAIATKQPGETASIGSQQTSIENLEQKSPDDYPITPLTWQAPHATVATALQASITEVSVQALEQKSPDDFPIPPLVRQTLIAPPVVAEEETTTTKPKSHRQTSLTATLQKTSKSALAQTRITKRQAKGKIRSFASRNDVWKDLLNSRTY